MGLYPSPLGLAARGTAWPTTRTCAQHTATPLLTSLSGLLRTQSQGLKRPTCGAWVLHPHGPIRRERARWHLQRLSSAPTRAHQRRERARWPIWFLGCWVASSSPRGAFSRKERMLWGRRSWPEILNIINTYPSLHRHPLPKLFTERHNINPYSDFLPEKSILQDTPNPCGTVPSSSPDALLWTVASTALGHFCSVWPQHTLHKSLLKSSAPSPSKPHTFSNPEEFTSLTFSPTALCC